LRMTRKAAKLVRNALRCPTSASGQSDVDEVFQAETLPEDFKHVMAVHYQALREYVPQPYPGPVTLLRARTRPLFRLHGRDLGWRALAGDRLEIIAVPGNHATFLTEPNVRVTARALRRCLEKAVSRELCHTEA